MNNNIKKVLLFAILLVPSIVFASVNMESMSLLTAIGMEAFITIHMTVFVIKPLSEILFPQNSKKAFWIMFIARIVILLSWDLKGFTNIALVDFFAVFIGAFTVSIVKMIKDASTKTSIAPSSSTTQNAVNNAEPVKVTVSPADFDSIYRLTENSMIESFLKREMTKAEIDNASKLIPSDILKRKKILNIIFSVLLLVYITLIFFHFPIFTYVIGLILLIIYFVLTRRYSLIKYLKKQLVTRPGEKITNIVMNAKNTMVEDNSRILLFASMIVAIIIPLVVFYSPKIIYEKVDGGYAVRYYAFGLTNFKTATIPETHNNQKIVSLRGNTFSNMFFLEEVKIPDSVTEIRGQAFMNCVKLTKVTIPSHLEYLGGGAFYNASSIRSIELPDSLTYLGGEAFYRAESLESISLSKNLTEIRGNTFEYCTSLRSITIPDNVTRIGGHAFYGDVSLTEVAISNQSKLREIGSSAFRQCRRLLNISIPRNTYVNERAFKESPTTINRFDQYN